MKRCPKCNNDFPDDANFCPVDAGHLIPIEGSSDGTPVAVPRVDTGGHELVDGRFALGDIVGGHRTGPVYSAGDKEGTTAMVKLVNSSVFPSALLKQRTERELKQLERLDHPGVAKVLAHGRREEELWIASERVDGVPLSQFVAENGPLGQARAISILSQIGSALEAAAKLGVTHRDLAPKNVLISEGDQAKLINFGVPTPGPEGHSDVQGVCEFLAPEQIEGRPVDQRCNIYSLGAIGYVLLTGKAPFNGAPADVLSAHSNSEVPPLGAEHSVSAELSAVLLKSLEKTSSKRFMTLRQFLGDLAKAEGTNAQPAPVAHAQGKPMAAKDANRTLMGVAPIELEALFGAKKAQQAPAAGDSAATTSIDHEPPVMESAASQTATTPQPVQPEPEPAPEAQPAPAPAMAPQPAPAQAMAPQPAPAPAVAPAAMAPAAMAPAAMAPAAMAPAAMAPAAAAGAGGKRKAAKAPAPKPAGNKGKFRETMWFKKGELDEAAAAAAAATPEQGASDKADLMEMDVRYNDDGSITQQDQERLSLRTGATMMMEAIPAEQRGEKQAVSEDYLVSEMTAGRNKILLGIGAAFVALGIVLAIVLS